MVGLRRAAARQNRAAGRFHDEALYFRIEFFKCRRAAGKGATRADEVAEGAEFATGLLENLTRCMKIVRAKVTLVMKLIGAEGSAVEHDSCGLRIDPFEIASRNLARYRLRQLIDEHNLSAKRLHHANALARIAPGHDCDEWIAFHSTHDRQAGTCVPAGKLDNRLARPERAVGLCVLDDLSGDAVFL